MSRRGRHATHRAARVRLVALGVAAAVSVAVFVTSLASPLGRTDDVQASRPTPTSSPTTSPPVTPSPTPTPEPTVPERGDGTFVRATGGTDQVGSGTLLRYRVEVERGVPVTPRSFAGSVDRTLSADRGWTRRGWAFERDPDAAVRIVLASPKTVDELCAPLRTNGDVSCRNGDDVVINAVRWFDGAESYGDDVAAYRIYVINHEVGHRLGFGHVGCPAPGEPAPVMLQQTLGLRGCTTNPWP